MGKKRSIHNVRNDSGENLSVPPGFVSLTSLTLKRVINSVEAAANPRSIDALLSNADVENFKATFGQRPWIHHDQFDPGPKNCYPRQTEVEMEHPMSTCLPKGVIRGCPNCDDCVKVNARWHPEESCLPVLDDAPVFYPTDEEFKDSLKFIAKIRPKAESYGICRIVPPPSWRPPCLLKHQKTWQASRFSTRAQRIDGLQNLYMKRKLSRLHEKKETKRPKVLSSMELESCNERVEEATTGDQSVALSSEFESGPQLTLQSFKKYADDFKKQYFCNKNDKFIDPNMARKEPIIARIEGEYWRIVENASEEIEVLSGTDSRGRTLGSGFSLRDSPANMAEYSEYVESGWNLNNIPKLSGSLLPYGCHETSAILVPQLFIGMCFASQCWRIEEHHLYSLSYMHFGDSKVWYGVPGRYCFKFMEVVKKLFPQLSKHHELLHELVTQLSPSMLMSEGIPVYRCVQNPLEFVLIFPGAYHSVFSCGFNCSESVSFAPFDWLPHGQDIVELYSDRCQKTSISHDRLLLRAAVEAVIAQWESLTLKNNSINNQLWISVCGKDGILTKAIEARVSLEGIRREHLCNLSMSRMLDEFDDATKKECSICQYDLYLSFVGCSCSPNRYTCLRHSKQLCCCAWRDKCIYFRYEITELNLLVEALEGNLKAIHSWAKKKIQPVAHSVVVIKDAVPNGMKMDKTTSESSSRGPGANEENKKIEKIQSVQKIVIILSDDEDE